MGKTKDSRQSVKDTLRLFQLDALFQDGKHYTAAQLMSRLEISIATLSRDISKLRNDYGAPLYYDKKTEDYYYTKPLFKLPAVFVNEDEMPAYSMVLNLFEMFHETPLYQPLINLVETFESPIKTDTDLNQIEFKNSSLPEKEWFETRIVMAKHAVDSVDEEIWNKILKALKNNFKLKFDYTSVGENRISYGKEIEPWQLIYDHEQWYIRARTKRSNGQEVVNTFVVPRMQNVEVMAEQFQLPDEKTWKLNEYAISSFGVTTTDHAEKIECLMQGSALYYAQANFSEDKTIEPYNGPLPHSQDAVKVTFTSNQQPAVLKEFLSFGPDIIPLAPPSFVEAWKIKVEQMGKYLSC